MLEPEDYYVEHGRWVFTEAYHLKRGHCCGSGCRHCPFQPQHQLGNTERGIRVPDANAAKVKESEDGSVQNM